MRNPDADKTTLLIYRSHSSALVFNAKCKYNCCAKNAVQTNLQRGYLHITDFIFPVIFCEIVNISGHSIYGINFKTFVNK